MYDGEEHLEILHVFNMFRNNQDYLQQFYIDRMNSLENRYRDRVRFVYHIVENDSTDNTKLLLLQFMKTRDKSSKLYLEDNLTCEYENKKSGKNYSRLRTLSEIRNTLVERARPLEGKWALFIDSHIFFDEDILERMFECLPACNNIGMLCAYTQQLLIPGLPTYQHFNLTKPALVNHYYDTFSFYNIHKQSYWPFCGFEQCKICPKDIKEKYNRDLIPYQDVTEVASCFSGFSIIRCDILNDSRVKWSTINYEIMKDEGLCEHVMFCELLRVLHNKRIVILQNVNNIYRTI
jgi:glycosyltransferase involved in cell wall biosynthesis